MISICREFVRLKPLITQQINLDALRPAGERRFDRDDLVTIRLTNTQLNGFCPPPLGYDPTSLTLQTARSALAVLIGYSVNQETAP